MTSTKKLTFEKLTVPGAYRIRGTNPHKDDRGSFGRVFCANEFADAGITRPFVQANSALNKGKAVLRGMHFLANPLLEGKYIRCTSGAIFDAFVDLRRGSPTFGKWHGEQLSGQQDSGLYIPAGCAHGYLTLTDISVTFYLVQDFYNQAKDRSLYWADPDVGIEWPNVGTPIVSEKDTKAARLSEINADDCIAFSS